MSYANPTILSITSPQGIDKVIQSIQSDLAALSWLTKSFGRAWEFSEKDENGKEIKIPKVWLGKDSVGGTGEYMNVLPNDHLNAQSFIACKGEEQWPEFDKTSGNQKERKLSVVFWFNLKQINPSKDYIFTEELKKDVEKKLKVHKYVKSIDAFYDEKVADIFDGYTINDAVTQYLMYPYSGFRFDITVSYLEEC